MRWLTDYGPDAWAESLWRLARSAEAAAVLAVGTDRGNEVMAGVGARSGLAMAANCLEIETAADGGEDWLLTRVRWGGSLHERARLSADMKLATLAPHATEPEVLDSPAAGEKRTFEPELPAGEAVTMVRERVAAQEGITLATAPVVVSGGRGVGSPEGFAALEELAEMLGGAVGCSRVVTNNGWRNHKFQVGQTGTVVAPDLYIACGISGAIQHWVGMMNSQNVLAVNLDREAPMVTKADWAGDSRPARGDSRHHRRNHPPSIPSPRRLLIPPPQPGLVQQTGRLGCDPPPYSRFRMPHME